MVRGEFLQPPPHLQIAVGLTLQTPTGTNAVEIAVEVQLEQVRWLIRWTSFWRSDHTLEAQRLQVQLVHEGVDKTHGIVGGNILV